MSLPPTIVLPFIIGVLSLNIFVLISIVFFSTVLLKRLMLIKDEAEEKKQEACHTAEVILEQARRDAAATVQGADKKAAQILNEAELLKRDAVKELRAAFDELSKKEREHLEKTGREFVLAQQNMAGESKKAYVKTVESAAHRIGEDARTTIHEFQKFLREEIARYQSVTDKRIEEWHTKAQQEIDDYKKQALSKIDESIYKIISSVSKRVIGEALDLESHQSFVIKALEEAKREGFFKP